MRLGSPVISASLTCSPSFLLHCSPSIVFENNTHFYLLLCCLITPPRSFILCNQQAMSKKAGTQNLEPDQSVLAYPRVVTSWQWVTHLIVGNSLKITCWIRFGTKKKDLPTPRKGKNLCWRVYATSHYHQNDFASHNLCRAFIYFSCSCQCICLVMSVSVIYWFPLPEGLRSFTGNWMWVISQ